MHHHKSHVYEAVLNWLPLAVAITGLCALVYGSVQQNYRQTANDPQIEIVEDASAALEQGAPPQALSPQNQIDLRTSLQPFIIIYSATGTPIVSSATLDGQPPVPPIGALNFAKSKGQNRLTWQPAKDVRIAAVIGSYKDGFVLAGRSLREVEKRTQMLTLEVGIAWIVTLVASLLLCLLAAMFKPHEHHEHHNAEETKN